MIFKTLRSAVLLLGACMIPATAIRAQVATPVSVLGHNPGDDRYLANYEETVAYFRRLAETSDRIKLVHAGKTTEGREFVYAVISSPENLRNLDKWIALSNRLADPRGLTDAQALDLARSGKIIVHIDGGMHSDEVADHQLPSALAYKLLAAKGDAEIDAILDNVILVLWPTLNPDGQDMVVDWYRKNLGTQYETSDMPWLYQSYVGHDNNRDGYMQNMIESRVVTRTADTYSPVIWYTQHQPAPFPARMWVPPFADPISSNISPYMRVWTNAIGINMMARFEKEQKPGVIAQARYDNWYPGYLDYTRVFRNTIAFYTEANHTSATPKLYKLDDFPKNMQDLRAQVMYPHPWKGGQWRLHDTIDYMLTASMSVLETAFKNRETLLYNRYQAGRDTVNVYATQGPFAYVVPAGQRDNNEAGLLVQTMIDNGVEVHRSPDAVTLGDKRYPAGSWVLLMDQPFAGLAKELFERQSYPDAILNGEGKPLDLPYDVTGWTLPLQMGVTVDVVTAPVSNAVRRRLAPVLEVALPGGVIQGRGTTYTLSHNINASFQVVNDVLAMGGMVGRSTGPVRTPEGLETGAFQIGGIDQNRLAEILRERKVDALAKKSISAIEPVGKPRVGLYRPWGVHVDEGWTRWLLEKYGFNPTSLYNKDVAAGDLEQRFDTIIIADLDGWEEIPKGQRAGADLARPKWPGAAQFVRDGLDSRDVPAPYSGGIGDAGTDALRKFVSAGGTLVALNHASDAVIELLGLPVSNILKDVKPETFLCSGALLQVELQSASAVTQGMPRDPIIMFEKGPAFETQAGFKGEVIASYPMTGNPLRSGVLLHPEAISGKIAALRVDYGKGHIFLFGFKPQWRGQSHGTYKLLFNALYRNAGPVAD